MCGANPLKFIDHAESYLFHPYCEKKKKHIEKFYFACKFILDHLGLHISKQIIGKVQAGEFGHIWSSDS